MSHFLQLMIYLALLGLSLSVLFSEVEAINLFFKVIGILFYLVFYSYMVSALWFLSNNKVSRQLRANTLGSIVHGSSYLVYSFAMFAESKQLVLLFVVLGLLWQFFGRTLYEIIETKFQMNR